jgi:predicted transcriptional regulator YdeE
MDYQIVALDEKIVAGLSARTKNSDPEMTKTVGGLWKKFYSDGIYQAIGNKKNDCTIGLYHHYESDAAGAYDITIGCEITKDGDLPEGVRLGKISAGKYAKFVVRGNVQQAVMNFWTALWQLPLDRKYSSDFEEYQSGEDMNDMEIHIYIALNDN